MCQYPHLINFSNLSENPREYRRKPPIESYTNFNISITLTESSVSYIKTFGEINIEKCKLYFSIELINIDDTDIKHILESNNYFFEIKVLSTFFVIKTIMKKQFCSLDCQTLSRYTKRIEKNLYDIHT